MNKLFSIFNKWATLRNAIVALALFGLNALLLQRLDQPLMDLAGGEPKLDLRFGYDLETVQRLFDVYGKEGRSIYVWNLLVDTPFPILGGIAVILFVLVAFHNPMLQKLLILPPIVFGVTDLIENVLMLFIIQSYPALSSSLVTVTSLITQVKRTAFYTSALELALSLLVIVAIRVIPSLRTVGKT